MSNDLTNLDMPTEQLSLSTLPDDAPEWAKVLNENIGSVMAVMNSTMRTIDSVAVEVQPMIDSLSKSPILKMMGVK